ncbi:MAG: hypothetical protein RJA81_873 [Planctomycetota bacterium]
MLRWMGSPIHLCEGYSRREILRIGGLGLTGSLGLNQVLAEQASGKPKLRARAKNCIVLMLTGGVPQQSTWDPKPDAPEQARGAYGPIATNVPGIFFSELMPLTARHADKLAVLRAVSTNDNAHSSSAYYMLTGRPHAPMNFENAKPGAPNDFPSLGAMVMALRDGQAISSLPESVTLPMRVANTDGSVWPGQDGGFLGRANDPWLVNFDPRQNRPSIAELQLDAGLEPQRASLRRNLLDQIAQAIEGKVAQSSDLDPHTSRAWQLITNSQARQAFDLGMESDKTRELYGRSPFGQTVLMARRLIESGVRLVQVNWYRGPDEPDQNPVWDTHKDETNRLKTALAPPMDRALSGLLSDLDGRGLLDETLVAVVSEFGRSPRLDGAAGRGHWGHVFSVALAGGGIQGGVVHGASDALAAWPKDGRVTPEDLHSTILTLLGIAPETELLDPLGRPLPLSRGEVIRSILA